MSFRNCSARDLLVELEAATTVWTTEWIFRVLGSQSRSLAKVWAIPPVARMPHRMVGGLVDIVGGLS